MEDVMILVRFSDSAIGVTGWGYFWLWFLCIAIGFSGRGRS